MRSEVERAVQLLQLGEDKGFGGSPRPASKDCFLLQHACMRSARGRGRHHAGSAPKIGSAPAQLRQPQSGPACQLTEGAGGGRKTWRGVARRQYGHSDNTHDCAVVRTEAALALPNVPDKRDGYTRSDWITLPALWLAGNNIYLIGCPAALQVCMPFDVSGDLSRRDTPLRDDSKPYHQASDITHFTPEALGGFRCAYSRCPRQFHPSLSRRCRRAHDLVSRKAPGFVALLRGVQHHRFCLGSITGVPPVESWNSASAYEGSCVR